MKKTAGTHVVLLLSALLFSPAAFPALALLGNYPISGARSVAVQGNLAYVCGTEGIRVIDMADPTSPSLVGELVGTAYADCSINGSALLATTRQPDAASPFELHVYSLKPDSRSPRLIGTSLPIEYSQLGQLIATRTHAYASQFQLCYEPSTLNIRQQGGDLLAMALNLDSTSSPAEADPLLTDVLFNSRGDLLGSYDVSDGCNLNGGDHHVWRMALADANTLLLASTSASGVDTQSGTGLVRVVDISIGAQVQEVKAVPIPGTVHAIGVAVDGDQGLVIGSEGGWFNPFSQGGQLLTGSLVAAVLDLEDPRSPVVSVSRTLPFPSRTLWSSMTSLGGRRYAFSSLGGVGERPLLLIVEAGNPGNLAVDRTELEHDLQGMNSMAVSGSRLLLADAGGLSIYDHQTAAAVPVASDSVDLAVTVEDEPDPVALGNTYAYSARVVNNGIGGASGVRFSLALPDDVVFISASPGCSFSGGRIDCLIGDLTATQAVVERIVVQPTHVGDVNAVASVIADQADSRPSDNNDASVTTVAASAEGITELPSADLAIKFKGPRKVKLNSRRVFALVIKNRSRRVISGVVVTGRVPDNVIITRLPEFCALADDQLVACRVDSLRKKAAKTFKLKVKATREGTVRTVFTIFSPNVADSNAANNSTAVSVKVK